ncbi:unnamed protein product [Hymenolepis diminuta]|uniref:Uncharacterized protein n=1 Tax=Hymenolepis diminuta TaxID=6216 RepID=A0A564XUV6_HYMDI|nr:unnamed protein product [Hymenolepis diminuta]VUZ41490.1 unnamed protein product [Hymenolepis diminuta]VUZ41495.1 unnamed protein product [Hymenolepis diminuta]
MCEIVNLVVTSGSPWINTVCLQVAHPHRSEKLSVPRMLVAKIPQTWLYWEPVLSTLSLHFPTNVPFN